jgi:hypothetical protein
MRVTGFTLAHLALQFVAIYLETTSGLAHFELELEQSIQRFFSAVTLLLCSSLFLIIAMVKKKNITNYFLYWLGLVLIFFLPITKMTASHENIPEPIRSALHQSRIQFYAWVYGIVAIIFPVLILKFHLDLPKRSIFLLVISGFTFFAAAFGYDLIVVYLGKSIDHHTLVYIGLAILEDVLEMYGIIVLVYELLSCMRSELKGIGV